MRLILLLFICIAYNANAQKIRLTDTSNKWNCSNQLISPSDPYMNIIYRYSYIGDTVVNGLSYLKTQFGLIREDSTTNKVYALNSLINYNVDTLERVLYDYTLNTGDTLLVEIDSANKDTSYYTVDMIDTVLVNGISHRVWHILEKEYRQFGTGIWPAYNYIEGIGSTKGLFYPLIRYEFENVWTLNCFENNGTRPILSKQIGYFNNTTSCKLSVNDVSIAKANVFPNPITAESKIVLPNKINSGTVTIYNSLGQVIKEQRLDNFREIYIGPVNNPGIYFYRILDSKSHSVYTGQFMSH